MTHFFSQNDSPILRVHRKELDNSDIIHSCNLNILMKSYSLISIHKQVHLNEKLKSN